MRRQTREQTEGINTETRQGRNREGKSNENTNQTLDSNSKTETQA